MLPLPRGAAWQTLFLLCAVLFINEIRSEGRVVCYYTNWSVYRPGTAKFNPQNINPYLCTHLVYAFGGFTKDNQMKPFDKYQDVEQGGYAKFTGLKTYNKQLKTMIAIGGWNEASSRFSPLMANPERRQQFIKNILKFLRQNHFDGIDLDWEYPAQREGGKQRDRDNYAQFVQELRAEFERESEKTGRPRLLLTMAVPAGIENIEKGYDIPKLNKYLDWFNVLTYDFHSSHEPSANHHAPLYSLEEESEYNYDAELNIDYSIKYYLKAGADRDKLVLGIPTYGRSYTLINEESTEIGAPSEGPGEQGDATREKGYLAYYEICQNLKDDPEWTVVQPNPNAMGPYAYRRNQWVGYDDEAIVRKKAQYVVEHGLGGIMFWAIDNDDFRGTCNGKPYPLIEAAKEAMLEGLGVGINEVAKPNNQHKKPSRSRSRENSSSKLNRIAGGKEGKGSTRTTLSSGRRRPQPSTTTTTERAPETTIRLTNSEGSSLYIGGRTTTPPPPTTPDPGADFKCEEEGFFQHPRDCKKYYWCLDSGPSGLGIVGHQFTCPSGLYFNPAADSCDFARNVPCKIKKATTPAPGASTTTTTTTPRPTSAPNRITAATSRSSFFRTTTSTTTTTPEPIEYEDEEEEVDDAVTTHTKERDSEEDPQVLKELIDLIRKVGGIEELEKHLQRKEDGTIALKNGGAESGASTTQSPISKNLYEKVLSKPNTYNSFRNRLTSTSLYRKTGQAKVAEKEPTKTTSDDTQASEVTSTGGSSKYSSVVRGNSRQGPQNEGLDKLSDFDGFLKEKKQYVTINRHRGAFRNKSEDDEDNETEAEEKKITVNDDEEEDDEEEETITKVKSTKRPTNTVTPSYASIRRTRPSTVHTDTEEEAINEENVKSTKESEEKRTYTLLSRNRGKYTTESSQAAEETVTNTNRYKYLERTRPTSRTQSTLSAKDEEITPADEDDDSEDEDNQEEEQNVTVQLNGAPIDSIQKSTQSTTTRTYANIGRRTTTTTTEIPITNTQETPTRYNLLENTFNNETPEPILTISTTEKTITTNDSPTLSISIKNTNPEIMTTTASTTSTSTSTSASHPSITTTKAAAITTTANDLELTDSLYTITTITPNFESDSRNTLDISFDVNSLIEQSALKANPTTASATTEKPVKPTESDDDDDDVNVTTTTTARTTSIATETNHKNTDTDVSHTNDEDEVTNLHKNINRSKTQYNKYTTRTRNITKTENTNTDLEHENSINGKISKNNNNKNIASDTKSSSSTRSSTDDKLSSNIRGNTVNKYSGGRRQQQQQLNELLTRKNPIQKNQQDSSSSTTNNQNKITTTDSTPTNEFLGTISSPRPFGFPRRRTRPNLNSNPNTAALTEDLKSTTTTESTEDETRLSTTQASKPKVSSNSIELQVENQNGLETKYDVSTISTRAQTKNLHSQKHVVVDKVDVDEKVVGINGEQLSNLRHDVVRNLSLSINNSFSAETSNSQANAQQNDKAESLKKSSEIEEKRNNRTAERQETTSKRDRIIDEHDELKELKENKKELKDGKDDENENRANTVDENKPSTRVQQLNILDTNTKDERLQKSKYRGKSLTPESEAEQLLDSAGKYRTRGLKMVSEDNATADRTEDLAQDQKVSDENLAAVTERQENDESKEKENLGKLDNKNSTHLTEETKSETAEITRTQEEEEMITTTATPEQQEEFITTNALPPSKDTSELKTPSTTPESTEGVSRTSTITENIEELATTTDSAETNKESGVQRKYQQIARNKKAPSTETIHYNTIVRSSKGVELTEDESSSFHRDFDEVVKQAEESRERVYQGISRGGKLPQITKAKSANERDKAEITSQRENSRFNDKTSKETNEDLVSDNQLSVVQEDNTTTTAGGQKTNSNSDDTMKDLMETENAAAEDNGALWTETSSVESEHTEKIGSVTTTSEPITTDLSDVSEDTTSHNLSEHNATTPTSNLADPPITTLSPNLNVADEIKESTNQPSLQSEEEKSMETMDNETTESPLIVADTTTKIDKTSDVSDNNTTDEASNVHDNSTSTVVKVESAVLSQISAKSEEADVTDASLKSSTEEIPLSTTTLDIETTVAQEISETSTPSSPETHIPLRRRPTPVNETVKRGRPESTQNTHKRISNRHRSGTVDEVTEQTTTEKIAKVRGRSTSTEAPVTTVLPRNRKTTVVTESAFPSLEDETTETSSTTQSNALPMTTVSAEAHTTTSTPPEYEVLEEKKAAALKDNMEEASTTPTPLSTDLPEPNESYEAVTTPTDASIVSDIPEATALPVSSSTSNIKSTTVLQADTTEDVTTSTADFVPDTERSEGSSDDTTMKSTTESEGTTTESTTAQSFRRPLETTHEYVLKGTARNPSLERDSLEETEKGKNPVVAHAHHEISSLASITQSKDGSYSGEDVKTRNHADSTTETPTSRRRIVYRGTYRPRKDEGDLSSLLAIDANKHKPYNHTEYNLGHRENFERTPKEKEEVQFNESGKSRAGHRSTEVQGDGANYSNKRRTSVIRRRLDSQRNSFAAENETTESNELVREDNKAKGSSRTIAYESKNRKGLSYTNSQRAHDSVYNTAESETKSDSSAMGSIKLNQTTSSLSVRDEQVVQDNMSNFKSKGHGEGVSKESVSKDNGKGDSTEVEHSAGIPSKKTKLDNNSGKSQKENAEEKTNEEGAYTNEGNAEQTRKESWNKKENREDTAIEEDSNTRENSEGSFTKEISNQRENGEEKSNEGSSSRNENGEQSENTTENTGEAVIVDNRTEKSNSAVTTSSIQNTKFLDSKPIFRNQHAQLFKNYKTKTEKHDAATSNVEISHNNAKENADSITYETTTGSPTFSARSRYSGRAQYPNRGSARTLNRESVSIKNEINANGASKTQTTYTRTFNADTNTQKTVKRVHTQNVHKTEPEYEYVYETVTEKVAPSTPRTVTRNRGSIRFGDSDLSSLLSLDFAPKTKRREDVRTIVKTKRKVIRKPAVVSENETVEEYEVEEEERKVATRPTRPSTVTTSALPISRRTRPTRPLRRFTTPTTLSSLMEEAEEESVLKKGLPFRHSIQKTSAMKANVEAQNVEQSTPTVETRTPTTRRGFSFKRPLYTTTTTQAPLSTTFETPNVSTYKPPLPGRVLKTQRPLNVIESVRFKAEEQAAEKKSIGTGVEEVFSGKSFRGSTNIATTEAAPETTAQSTTTTTEATSVRIAENENVYPQITTGATEAKPAKAMSAIESETPTTTSTTITAAEVDPTIHPGSVTENNNSQASEAEDDSFDFLKKQFSNALSQLKENAEEKEDLKQDVTLPTQKESTTTTEKSEAETEAESIQELTSQRAASHLQNELNTSDEDSSISLPIYHRRKYFHYYKDSPIIYIGKPQLPEPQAQISSIDFRKQIRDVFNISHNDNISVAQGDKGVSVEAATAHINNANNHFLLKTPGSK